MKNDGDTKLPTWQMWKLNVLEEVTGGTITNREASATLRLSIRRTQSIKTGFKEAEASLPVQGNMGLKPSNYITCEN